MVKGSHKPDAKDYMLRVRMTEEDKIWLECLRQYYGESSASEFVRKLIVEQKERMDREIAECEGAIKQLTIDDCII